MAREAAFRDLLGRHTRADLLTRKKLEDDMAQMASEKQEMDRLEAKHKMEEKQQMYRLDAERREMERLKAEHEMEDLRKRLAALRRFRPIKKSKSKTKKSKTKSQKSKTKTKTKSSLKK